ncbi:MAG TPA: orotidine-5'-phosphate decarboxylase [Phycisphaerae bacterium]|nr:orotidine-5'-phosphate decarboxylase [Phycisphaerae bacterium]
MLLNFADRLIDAVAAKRAPAVIALDPVLDRLPEEIRAIAGTARQNSLDAAAEALWEFGWRVIRTVAPLVPAIKINSAYFEVYRARGVEVYYNLVAEAAQQGLLVIGDVKRGDVGHSAEMYALAQLAEAELAEADDRASPDAITVNGYFGLDGIQPFIEVAKRQNKGLFVLVRTSNPSAGTIQDIAASDGKKMHEVIASEVARWSADPGLVGERGYSSLGAVTATRDPEDARRLRAAMPRSFLLVPGYGAQGGKAEDFAPYCNPDGGGAIVAAGRSVIFAHDQARYRERFGAKWEACVQQACLDFVADLARIMSHMPGR